MLEEWLRLRTGPHAALSQVAERRSTAPTPAPKWQSITVTSVPDAAEFYRKMGFVPRGDDAGVGLSLVYDASPGDAP